MSQDVDPNPVPAPEYAPPSPEPKAASPQRGVIRGNQGIETAQGIIAAFLAGMIAVLALVAAVGAPLHGPDLDLFPNDAAFAEFVRVPEAFEVQPHAPLTLFSFALQREWLGAGASGLQLGNLFLLGLAVALAVLWLRAAFPAAPVAVLLGAALLVGLHPVTGSATAMAAGRHALLGAVLGQLSLFLLLRATARPRAQASAAFGLAAYLAAVSASLPWIVLPGVFLVLLQVRDGVAGLRKHAPLAGCLLGLAALLLLARAAAPTTVLAQWPAQGGAPWAWLGDVVMLQGRWPDFGADAWGLPALLVPALLVALGLALAASRRVLGAALVWVGLGLLAEACFLPPAAGSGVLPLLGGMVGVVALFAALPSGTPRRLAGFGLAALVLAAGAMTYTQVAAWGDPIAFWSAKAAVPGETAPLKRLGEYLAHRARTAPGDADRAEARQLAEEVWRGVLAGAPEDAAAAGALGALLVEAGRGEEAEPLLLQAVAADPLNAAHTLNLALALERWVTFRDGRIVPPSQRPTDADLDRQRRAADYFARAAALAPLPREAQIRYGFTLALLGNREAGLPLLREALAGDAEFAPLLEQFGTMVAEAAALEASARQALATGTATPEARLQRATAYLRQDRLVPARYGLQSLARDVEQTTAWVQLGLLSHRLGELPAFLGEFGPVQRERAALWTDLAARLAAAGQWDAAETTLQACGVHAVGAEPAPAVLAELAQALGQADRATAYLKALAALRPEDPAPWRTLAELAEAAGRAAEAEAHRAEAARRGGEAPPAEAPVPAEGGDTAPRRAIERTVIR